MRRMLIISALLVVGFASAVAGQVPRTISYQGVMKDGEGAIVPDDDYDFIFKIYNASSGGTALWTENQTKHVSAGVLNVVLGDVSPIGLPFDEPYWLGFTIGAGSELTPRTLLTGTPYALNARAVLGTYNEFPDSGFVGVGTIDPTVPLHIVGDAGTQVGLRYDGNDPSYTSIYVNALQGTAKAMFGYLRSGILYGYHYMDVDNAWKVKVSPGVDIAVEPTGRVGIGTESPTQRLDVNGGIKLGNTLTSIAGTMRWTGTDFEGYDGSDWVSMTGVGSGGYLPAGSYGQTLRCMGDFWVGTSNLYNNGQKIGIGTVSPEEHLHMYSTSPEIIKIESNSDEFRAGIELNTPTGGDFSFAQLMKYGPTAIGSSAGIPFANLTHLCSHFNTAGILLETYGGDPIYFATTGVERMRIASSGNVGIGVTDPQATLDIFGGNWDLDGSEGDLKIGDDTHRLKIGVATGGLGAGTAGIRMQGGLEKLILGAGADEVMTVRSGGDVDVGGESQTGQLGVWRSGFTFPGVSLNTSDDGGRVAVYDENGYLLLWLRPDLDGEGGVLEIKRAPLQTGFAVYGNVNGTQEPMMYVWGSERYAVFDMSVDGDSCVTLPVSSVASHEMFDEPGTASAQEGVSSIILNPSVQTLLSRSIIVPAAGYIQVIGTLQSTDHHSQGLPCDATFGVSDNATTFPANQDVDFHVSATASGGEYTFPVTVHGLFEVSSGGTYTYYLLGQGTTGNIEVSDLQLTLMYVPTAYGTVVSTASLPGGTPDGGAPERPALTRSEMAAERIESESFNRDRIERELARMSERLEVMKRELERENRDADGR